MSAIKLNIMKVAVTNGDAIDENRKKGRSNTGTYFISSKVNFNNFSEFIDDSILYTIDVKKIQLYQTLFNNYFLKYKNDYPGKMNDFDLYCDSFYSMKDNPIIKISLRENDERVFLRFSDNNNLLVNSFRHILYGELSMIVFDLRNNKCIVYPEINDLLIDKPANNIFIFEEE